MAAMLHAHYGMHDSPADASSEAVEHLEILYLR